MTLTEVIAKYGAPHPLNGDYIKFADDIYAFAHKKEGEIDYLEYQPNISDEWLLTGEQKVYDETTARYDHKYKDIYVNETSILKGNVSDEDVQKWISTMQKIREKLLNYRNSEDRLTVQEDPRTKKWLIHCRKKSKKGEYYISKAFTSFSYSYFQDEGSITPKNFKFSINFSS